MDRRKVKELIENAIYQLDPFTMDRDNYDDFCKNATKILEKAKEELSKSDWVPVEDGLPPYGKIVCCVNSKYPFTTWMSNRIKEEDNDEFTVDSHDFIRDSYGNHSTTYYNEPVTHWKPIEKLEE